MKRGHKDTVIKTEPPNSEPQLKKQRTDNNKNTTTTIKLKQILSQRGISNDVYNKLLGMGIGWNILLYIENKDLDTLCGEQQLNLSFTTKLKFKTAIKQIQSKYK
eukprot:349079_1